MNLEERLGVTFTDSGLLELALTHRSYAFEAGGLPTNERLEFLGDAVLGVVVTDRIYRRHPQAPEGRLAKLRAAAVNAHSLAEVGRVLGLGADVMLGRGEEQSGGREKDSILADTLEAIIGAVYLDQGMDAAFALVRRLFDELLVELAERPTSLDHKTSLQELAAAELGALPVYEVSAAGPDHAKRFSAVVSIDGEALGAGTGRSKKGAEQEAAKVAVETLRARFTLASATHAGD